MDSSPFAHLTADELGSITTHLYVYAQFLGRAAFTLYLLRRAAKMFSLASCGMCIILCHYPIHPDGLTQLCSSMIWPLRLVTRLRRYGNRDLLGLLCFGSWYVRPTLPLLPAHHAHCNPFVSEPLSLTSWLHHNHRVLVIPQKIPAKPISNIPDEKCQSNYSVSCRLAEIGLQFLCTISRSS